MGNPKSAATLFLESMTDAELEALAEIMTLDRIGTLIGMHRVNVAQHFAARGISKNTQGPRAASPLVTKLKRHIRDLEQGDEALQELARTIKASAEAYPPPRPAKRAKVPRKKGRAPVDIVLHVSDKQFGEVVHSDVPGGGYSPEIYEKIRLPRWIEAVEGIFRTIASAHPIGTVWIAQGGDFAEGEEVFAGQHYHLAMDAGEQVVVLPRLWAPAVQEVATEAKSLGAERVAMVGVVGNHGVHGGRKSGAVPPTRNYDHLIYTATALHLEAMKDRGGVDFIDREARKAVYFEAAGHLVLMTHGDQDRGGGLVGVPVVTGLRNDLSVRMQTETQHRYHLKGHYHRPTTITVGGSSMTLWNGDWCGANNLSVGRGGGSHPTQHVYVMHPEYGLQSSWPIRLAGDPVPVEVLR